MLPDVGAFGAADAVLTGPARRAKSESTQRPKPNLTSCQNLYITLPELHVLTIGPNTRSNMHCLSFRETPHPTHTRPRRTCLWQAPERRLPNGHAQSRLSHHHAHQAAVTPCTSTRLDRLACDKKGGNTNTRRPGFFLCFCNASLAATRDAIVVKRHKLRLLIADPHGGVTRSTHMWLRSLSKRARVGRDATVYGSHSPRAFTTHHGACMSYACVRGEADAFQKDLSALERAHTARAA